MYLQRLVRYLRYIDVDLLLYLLKFHFPLRENATVTMCHSRTTDLAAVCRSGDVLCAAVGRAKMIQGDWIKPGAVVIDFGVNFVDGQMCGDVDFEEAVQIARMVTPVPGGTGPMTNVMLLRNVLEAAERQA